MYIWLQIAWLTILDRLTAGDAWISSFLNDLLTSDSPSEGSRLNSAGKDVRSSKTTFFQNRLVALTLANTSFSSKKNEKGKLS